MRSPVIVFDHIRKVVLTLPTGRSSDKRLSEMLKSQQKIVGKPECSALDRS